MGKLKNARHEAFAVSCFSGMTQADAYKKHYPTSLGWKDGSVHCEASKLHTKVLQRIQELQAAVEGDAIMSKIELAELYTRIMKTKHSDFLTMSADGVWFHDIGPETLSQEALKKVKTRITNVAGSGDALIEKQFDEIELESKVSVGQALAKLMGYNEPDKREHSGKIEVEEVGEATGRLKTFLDSTAGKRPKAKA